MSKTSPEITATALGELIAKDLEEVIGFNVVKGFLNLEIANSYWIQFLNNVLDKPSYGFKERNSENEVMVEYSSPNTNKPLHLGHLRNNFLGYSVAKILEANGHKVQKVQIINDRGIHICKSMISWKNYGEGETPETSGLKGDKLVGKYYVKFDQVYKSQVAALIEEGSDKETAEKNAPIIDEARELLQKWGKQGP